MSRSFVVFDTECATARGAPHLIEVGAVRVVDGEVAQHFEALVRPEIAVDPEAFEVHGIDDAMLRDARPALDVIAELVRFLGDDWLVAHDAARDARVLGFEAARHGLELPGTPIVDTLKLARRCVPEASDHKLETLARHFEIDVDVQHRALADAVTCWRVFEECLARLDVDPQTDGDVLLLQLLPRAGSRATLATARPRLPRMSPRLRPLERACRDRGRVTIVYGEEGAPAHLDVAPRILFEMGDKGYLEAECARSGLIKTYRLDRVRRVVV